MSDALAFLVQARPEAMGHYLAFLKDCGSRLDPKTRALISVITKVHAQTERGLRQYVKRALRDGCSADEVLDALLMAFPALGLSKIIWAVDVMLAMDLPGLRLVPPAAAPAAAAPAWHEVMATRGVPDGHALRVDCDGRALFVLRQGRRWQVYDSRCPHQSTDMPELALQGDTLTCPQHGWTFSLQDGRCTAVGDKPLRRWPSKVVRGRLLTQW
jgi:nitrite reductase/ring-hydroxylating ferredoxin subunit/alkylhydroperoxidase/carboxymuconolactone decarboxylase family protein YurZ